MVKSLRVNGYTFKYNEEHEMYECRGEVCYDDEHDEVPEQGLWIAACKLASDLKQKGFNAEPEHSEKGWVEVLVFK